MRLGVWFHRDGRVCRLKRRGHGAGNWYSRSYAHHRPHRSKVMPVRCYRRHEWWDWA